MRVVRKACISIRHTADFVLDHNGLNGSNEKNMNRLPTGLGFDSSRSETETEVVSQEMIFLLR